MTSTKAQAYCTWIYWIIMKNMPLALVEDTHHRNFSHVKTKISYKSVVKVIGKSVELVEQKIKAAIDLSKAYHGHGAILYDGWDGGSKHYVGLFLLFTCQVMEKQLSEQILVGEPHIVLLACSPINHTEDDDGKATDAVTFNAEQNIEFFQELLLFYGLTFSDRFITNQIADNTSVNKKIARILELPHVGCTNHKFNLEVEDYLK
jgi:hypothetical protein